MSEVRRNPVSWALVATLRFYQKFISPLKMGSTCRFEPVCSTYSIDAISHHGPIKGVVMTTARLSKCGPWHPGGYDPVQVQGLTTTDSKEF